MTLESILCEILLRSSCPPNYSTEDILIWVVLVPSVLLIMFLTFAAKEFLRGFNLKMDVLLAIIFYIVIVYSGWYGFIVNLGQVIIPLFLLIMLGYFLLGRFFFHPKTIVQGAKDIRGWYKKAREIPKSNMDQLVDKLSELLALEGHIANLRGQLNYLMQASISPEDPRYQNIEGQIRNLEAKEIKLRHEIEKLIRKVGVDNIRRNQWLLSNLKEKGFKV